MLVFQGDNMATIKIAENITEIEAGGYPCGELFNAIARMLNERTEIKIVFAGDIGGDVAFEVKYADLGITPQTLLKHKFFTSHVFINFLAELLVRQNLNMFSDRLLSKSNYDTLVKSHRHLNFGTTSSKGGEALRFTFHISLYYNLLNESLNRLISDEVAKITPAAVPAQRIKRGEENAAITTFEDNNNLRLLVSKTHPLRICLENAMEKLLEHFGIKKEILVNDNMFNFEFSISDKATQK